MSNYLEIKIDVNQLYSELVGNLLSAFDCKEIVLSEEYFSDVLTDKPNSFIKAYFPVSEYHEKRLLELTTFLKEQRKALLEQSISPEILGSWDLSYKIVGENDWAECWKKYWHPEKIGNKIVICPSWEEYTVTKNNEIIINLDPGGAFGTGSHPTTQLSIIALENIFSNNESINTVIDIGTGSGILAIVAAKFGAKSVFGIDIDPVAIEVSVDNAKLNNVYGKCKFDSISLRRINKEYDLVVVNILAKTILAMAEDIRKIAKKNGYVILSGLISKTLDNVKNSFEALGFSIENTLNDQEWFTIIARRD